MANGYSPYSVAQTLSQLEQSGLKTEQLRKQSIQKTSEQKGKMKEQFEREVIEAQRKANEALQRQRSKGKGLGFLSKIIGAFSPIAGGVLTGLTSALEGKKSGKHQLKMAKLAKDYATNLPSSARWGKTFLGGAKREYTGAAEEKYGEILRQAEDIAKETSGLGMLKTGVMSGMTGYATGKAMEGLGEVFKGSKLSKGLTETQTGLIKDVQPSFLDEAMTGTGLEKIATIQDMYPELANIAEGDLLKMLQDSSVGDNFLERLIPYIKGVGEKFGQTDPFGKGEGGQSMKGLIALLSQIGK